MSAIVWCQVCQRKLVSHAPHALVPQHISIITGAACHGIGTVGVPVVA